MPILRVTTKTGSVYVVDQEDNTWRRVLSSTRIDDPDEGHVTGTLSKGFDIEMGQSMQLLQGSKIINTAPVTNIAGKGHGKRDYSI